jgi:cytochrome c-type biogenesis protein CcmH/NrfG
VRLKPDWLEALNNLAWILATQPDEKLRSGTEAVRLAAHAVALTKTNNPGALDTLAASYAEAGRFAEAAAAAQTAAALAAAAGQAPLAAEIQKRRQAYQARQPFRE